jgi:hypothetical protein
MPPRAQQGGAVRAAILTVAVRLIVIIVIIVRSREPPRAVGIA